MMFVNSGCKCIGHQTVRIKRTTQFRSLTASICTYRLVGEQKLVRIRSEQTLSYRKRNEKKSATTLRSDPCRHRGHRLCNIGQQSEQLPTDVPVHPWQKQTRPNASEPSVDRKQFDYNRIHPQPNQQRSTSIHLRQPKCSPKGVCKVEEYNQRKRLREKECEDAEKQRLLLEQEQRELYERQRLQIAEADSQERVYPEEAARKRREQEEAERIETSKISPESRTCFMCKSNLKWMCQNDEYAHCGQYISLGVPKHTPPETAKICRRFRISLEKGNT